VADGYESLGKARLDLETNLIEFEKDMAGARKAVEGMEDTLDHLAAIADLANHALKRVKMSPGQGAESRVSAEGILAGVHHISDESREAARHLDRVKLHERQAAESEVPAGLISRMLDRITRKANEARRSIESVRIVGGLTGRTGVGIGPFGSGFGRVGVLGAAIGAGAALAPAAGPGAAGLLAAIPALAFTALAALGPLVLAFQDVGKAIGGDKKAFDELTPSAQKFVLTVRSLHGFLERLRETAGKNLFPGLTSGLQAALSPGTVGVLTHGIGELSQALGGAFAQWGHYFGSPQFQALLGPLMHQGAVSIGLLSAALLHLFDAFAVLGRAAIPFTTWLLRAIERGSRLASTWMRAKEASGALGRGLDEAKTSLRLVGGLFLSLLRVVGAFGHALYPISKVLLKELTHGLNGLAGWLNRNRSSIQQFASILNHTFVFALKTAWAGVRTLLQGLQAIVGRKGLIIAAIAAIGVAIAFSLGPYGAAIAGALLAVGLIRRHWRSLAKFFVTLGLEIVNSFKWVWAQLRRGALYAALAVVEPFTHLPWKMGGWARRAKKSFQHELSTIHAPNMNWSAAAARAGMITGEAWGAGFTAAVNAAIDKKREHGGVVLRRGGLYVPPPKGKDKDKPHREPKPGTHAWYMKYLGYDPTQGADDPFGKPPPFDKNVPKGKKPPPIPATVSHLEQLASREASMAATAKSRKARLEHLKREIDDLEKADRILHERYAHAHGQARERLFREITKVENAIRRAHAEMRKKLKRARRHDPNSREERLKEAVDRAKLAVADAKEGTAAYDRAVKAEEKALAAEIRFYDKRAHNAKLSAEARDRALRAEIAAKHQLAALHKKAKHDLAGGANIAQFLQSFAQIQSSFAPNTLPLPPGGAGAHHGGKAETHLHNVVHELRAHTRYLRDLVAKHAFPATGYAIESGGAVAG
jgi:hypothetical protein